MSLSKEDLAQIEGLLDAYFATSKKGRTVADVAEDIAQSLSSITVDLRRIAKALEGQGTATQRFPIPPTHPPSLG